MRPISLIRLPLSKMPKIHYVLLTPNTSPSSTYALFYYLFFITDFHFIHFYYLNQISTISANFHWISEPKICLDALEVQRMVFFSFGLFSKLITAVVGTTKQPSVEFLLLINELCRHTGEGKAVIDLNTIFLNKFLIFLLHFIILLTIYTLINFLHDYFI